MPNPATLAAPHGQAIFSLAKDEDTIPAWRDWLNTLATTTQEPLVCQYLANPTVACDDKIRLLQQATPAPSDQLNAWLRVVAQYQRFDLFSEIYKSFMAHVEADQQRQTIRITSAHPIDEATQEALQNKYEQACGQTVAIDYDIDPTLLAGMVVQINDIFTDYSIRGKLNKLRKHMTTPRG